MTQPYSKAGSDTLASVRAAARRGQVSEEPGEEAQLHGYSLCNSGHVI